MKGGMHNENRIKLQSVFVASVFGMLKVLVHRLCE